MADSALMLLLPGTLCDARVFEPLRQHWTAIGFDPVVKVVDMHSLRINRDLSTWWADQIGDHAGPFQLLGFSLGGVLALDALARMPERVASLALVASNALPGGATQQARVHSQLAQWHTLGPEAVVDVMLNQAAVQAVDALRPLSRAMACDTPTAAFEAQSHLNAHRRDGRPALKASSCPLLLVSGMHDPWCGRDKQMLIQEVRPDAIWHELEAHHYIPLAQPQALARVSADFFS